MNPVMIDTEKCVGCGLCVRDCVAGFLHLENGKAAASESGCIRCGHCYAVCPQDAISLPGLEPGTGELVDMAEFDSQRLLQAMKSRRSIRQFSSRPVEQEKIDMILEAGRYCPTGSNSQDVTYTILGSRQDEIEELCVNMLKVGIGAAARISAAAKRLVFDDHFFFKGAPLVILVSGRSSGNANLASSYMELMAESLGLGVLYSGYFVACSKIHPKVSKILDIPMGQKVVNCMVIGYPAVKYQRIPGRKPISLRKL